VSGSQVQTRNTFLEGVELAIKDIPLIAFCHSCQQEYKPEIGLQYSCPDCKSPMDDIRSGRELKIDRLEYSSTNNCKDEQRREANPLGRSSLLITINYKNAPNI
jgi:hypothetical protein